MNSALHPAKQSLILPLLLSVVGHGFMVGAFAFLTLLLTFCGPRKTIIDPDSVMEVSMVLAKTDNSMPDRATRAPEVSGAPEPSPVPKPDVNHNSDLAIVKDKAETTEGQADARKREEDLMRQLEMEAAMDAAMGTINQAATDPDSEFEEGATSGNIGTPSDPEYARYIMQIQQLFDGQFHPLQSIKDANPGIKCVIHVTVEPDTGRIIRYDVRSSGNEAWDAAARRAVESITSIPLPPEKYRERMGQGYDVEF